jgi:hypothetical protein
MARRGKIEEAVRYLVEHCYDAETELLTAEGFKKFDEIGLDTEIATLNPKTGCIEYLKPVKVHKLFYKGKMVHFKGRLYDLLVTPEHLIYCSLSPRGTKRLKFKFIPAIVLHDNYKRQWIALKRNAKWKCADLKTIILPRTSRFTIDEAKQLYQRAFELRETGLSVSEINRQLGVHAQNWFRGNKPKYWDFADEVPVNKWLRFFGWWLAEGWTNKTKGNHVIGISQVKSQEKRKKIIKAIKDLGISNVFVKRDNITFSSKQLYSYLKQFGDAREKHIPKEIKNLPPRRLKVLFESMIEGDGWKYKNHRYCYSTTSKRLADDFQEICLKLGYTATVKKYAGRGFSRGEVYVVSVASKCGTPRICKEPELVDYDGFVYDVTMPKNHIILVRRNGKPVWSSNCPGITVRMIADILEIGYWTAYRAAKSWMAPEAAKILEKEAEETATLEKWLPEQITQVKEQAPTKEPKIVAGPLWRGQITLWPYLWKKESELLEELKHILTLEGYPTLTKEEEQELKKKLHEYWQAKTREKLTAFF